jgi:tetratricopeptide (TPR) repeat protein
MRSFACFLALAWLIPAVAVAQVDLVDPDAAQPAKLNRPPPAEDTTDDASSDDGTLPAPPTKKAPLKGQVEDAAKGAKPAPKPPEPPPKKEPPALVVRAIGNGDLTAAWKKWAAANESKNQAAELAARNELVELKNLIGSTNAELWAIGMLRAAQKWEAAGDSGAAVEIAVTASELAPDLPATWFLLTQLYFTSDPSGIGRYVGALRKGVSAQLADQRYLRPMLADLAAVFLIALMATCLAVVLVLVLRRGYYFLYDFHFFLPRAAARWQSAALAIMVLSLPVVFRLGLVPTLLTLFAAVTLYLSMIERVVAAVLISVLGLVPLAGELVVEKTAFADTPAESLYLVERGGPGVEPLIQKLEKLAAEDKVGFAERFVLGHFHLRRGHLDQCLTHLKSALALRPADVPTRVALAKALFLQGDLENSRAILEKVSSEGPSSVVLYDLSRIYARRAQVYGDAKAGEVGKSSQFLMEARQLDPSLPAISADEPQPKEIIGNSYLKTLPLVEGDLLSLSKSDDAGKRVRGQLAHLLVGDIGSQTLGLIYPVLLAALLVGFGTLRNTLAAAKVCARCGRPVSRRGDPEVSPGSSMCTQCVNVFAKKNVVAPSVKVRKQLEVARYESRIERLSTIFGVLWSGMGDVFAGKPIRGTAFGFLFVLAIVGVVLRAGVVRPPFEGLPLVVRLVPLALLFLTVYPVSLLRLRKKG